MDLDKVKKKAKFLWNTWWISYVVCLVVLRIYDIAITFETGQSPITLFSAMHIVVILITVLFFLPLILVTNHYARIAKMKLITIITNIISLITIIWTVFNFVAAIYYFING